MTKLNRVQGPLQDNLGKQFGSGAGSGGSSNRQLQKFRFRNRVFGGVTSIWQLPEFHFRKCLVGGGDPGRSTGTISSLGILTGLLRGFAGSTTGRMCGCGFEVSSPLGGRGMGTVVRRLGLVM